MTTIVVVRRQKVNTCKTNTFRTEQIKQWWSKHPVLATSSKMMRGPPTLPAQSIEFHASAGSLFIRPPLITPSVKEAAQGGSALQVIGGHQITTRWRLASTATHKTAPHNLHDFILLFLKKRGPKLHNIIYEMLINFTKAWGGGR